MRCVIALEGIDGSGKTTTAEIIRKYALNRGLICAVIKTGGALTPEDEEQSQNPDERRRLFWDSLVNSEICRQYGEAQVALQESNLLVLDRTYLSYLMGKTRLYGQPISPMTVAKMERTLRDSGCFVPWDILWHIQRSPGLVLEGLHMRGSVGLPVSKFDRFLMENPDFLAADQERMKQIALQVGAEIVPNDADIETLTSTVWSRLDLLLGGDLG